MTPAAEPAYVAAVLMLYVDLPDTPLRPNPQDQSMAHRLYHLNNAQTHFNPGHV